MYNVRFYILFFTKLSIFSAVKGVRSTGLESNVYDVVITAGGFAKEKLFYKSLWELVNSNFFYFVCCLASNKYKFVWI